MSIDTNRCSECGDVVLRSFLKTHVFYVHGEGASQIKKEKSRHSSRKKTSPEACKNENVDKFSNVLPQQNFDQIREEIKDFCQQSSFSRSEAQSSESEGPFAKTSLKMRESRGVAVDEKPLGKPLSIFKSSSKSHKERRAAEKAEEKKKAKQLRHLQKMKVEQARKKAKKSAKMLGLRASSQFKSASRRSASGPKPILGRPPGSRSMWAASPGRWMTIVRG